MPLHVPLQIPSKPYGFPLLFIPVLFQWSSSYELHGIINKRPWFTFAYTENGSGASFALLNKVIKIWCASTFISRYTRLWTLLSPPEGFMEIMQRGLRERGMR